MQSIGFLGPAFFLTQLSHVDSPAMAVLCMSCSQVRDPWYSWNVIMNLVEILVISWEDSTSDVLSVYSSLSFRPSFFKKRKWESGFSVLSASESPMQLPLSNSLCMWFSISYCITKNYACGGDPDWVLFPFGRW